MTDAFWDRVAPLIPPRPVRSEVEVYKRKPGGGRKPEDSRVVFEALEWERRGCVVALWRADMAEHDDMEGIEWRWQAIDGAMASRSSSS